MSPIQRAGGKEDAELFRLLIESVTDYAIFLLDPQGNVASWNAGAERIKGYQADEIIGRHFSCFYPQDAIDRDWPAHELLVAGLKGPNQAAPKSGMRLLVVDDNADAAASLALLLRLQGHEVQVVHDGPSALELATRFRPDVIFLDIGMPGMDGYEVARRLRGSPGLAHVVLAALTGWGQKDDQRRTAEAGFNYHLVKPLEPKDLGSVFADLKRPRTADEGRR